MKIAQYMVLKFYVMYTSAIAISTSAPCFKSALAKGSVWAMSDMYISGVEFDCIHPQVN